MGNSASEVFENVAKVVATPFTLAFDGVSHVVCALAGEESRSIT